MEVRTIACIIPPVLLERHARQMAEHQVVRRELILAWSIPLKQLGTLATQNLQREGNMTAQRFQMQRAEHYARLQRQEEHLQRQRNVRWWATLRNA